MREQAPFVRRALDAHGQPPPEPAQICADVDDDEETRRLIETVADDSLDDEQIVAAAVALESRIHNHPHTPVVPQPSSPTAPSAPEGRRAAEVFEADPWGDLVVLSRTFGNVRYRILGRLERQPATWPFGMLAAGTDLAKLRALLAERGYTCREGRIEPGMLAGLEIHERGAAR